MFNQFSKSDPKDRMSAISLGRVDEFNQAKACGEGDDGSEIPGGLFAA